MTPVEIPGRNPLSYCRLCLTQVNILKVLESAENMRQLDKELLQKLFHYSRITFNNAEDYPSAVCYECIDKFNEFHEFRRMIVRNHNAVKDYRKKFGDEINYPLEEEQETTLIELIDGAHLTEIKQELDDYEDDAKVDVPKVPEPKPTTKETVKEVDVYHLDGELKNVVVKEEKLSPVRSLPGAAVSSPSPRQSKSEDTKKSQVTVLNKNVAGVKRPQTIVLNSEHLEKRTKLATGHGFSIVKCSQCRAVFRSRENLIIHERNDHAVPTPTKTASPKKTSTSPAAGTSKSPSQKTQPVGLYKSPSQTTQHVALYKCTHCSNSFIHKDNFEKHLQSCKAGILAKLNPQITVKRTAPAALNETKAAVAKAGDHAHIIQAVKKEEPDEPIIPTPVVRNESEDQIIHKQIVKKVESKTQIIHKQIEKKIETVAPIIQNQVAKKVEPEAPIIHKQIVKKIETEAPIIRNQIAKKVEPVAPIIRNQIAKKMEPVAPIIRYQVAKKVVPEAPIIRKPVVKKTETEGPTTRNQVAKKAQTEDQIIRKYLVKKDATESGNQTIQKQAPKKEETEDSRIRCHYCPLTYKTKYFLKKHMLDVHKIDDYEDVFYCHVCKLNYSCNEDLQLHNRAIHRFQCKQCLEDFRTCMHSQIYAKSNENGINKGMLG